MNWTARGIDCTPGESTTRMAGHQARVIPPASAPILRRASDKGYKWILFPERELADQLRLIASPDGRDGSLTIYQEVEIRAGRLSEGAVIEVDLGLDRHGWIQVARGRLGLESDEGTVDLAAGDGLAISDQRAFKLTAREPSELLVFTLA